MDAFPKIFTPFYEKYFHRLYLNSVLKLLREDIYLKKLKGDYLYNFNIFFEKYDIKEEKNKETLFRHISKELKKRFWKLDKHSKYIYKLTSSVKPIVMEYYYPYINRGMKPNPHLESIELSEQK